MNVEKITEVKNGKPIYKIMAFLPGKKQWKYVSGYYKGIFDFNSVYAKEYVREHIVDKHIEELRKGPTV